MEDMTFPIIMILITSIGLFACYWINIAYKNEEKYRITKIKLDRKEQLLDKITAFEKGKVEINYIDAKKIWRLVNGNEFIELTIEEESK